MGNNARNGVGIMIHLAKVAVTLEHLVSGVALELGETDSKKLMKWRHLYRDDARPVYKLHVNTGAPYMSDLLEIAVIHSRRIQTIYTKKNETPMERYQRAIRAEGSQVIQNTEGTR
jgi:hypothetical protein